MLYAWAVKTGGGMSGAVDVGNIFVRLVPMHDRSASAEEFAAIVRNEVEHIAGVTLAVFVAG